MSLFRKVNRMASEHRRLEESLYAHALAELAEGDIRLGLWAKALAESEGNEDKAAARYLTLRVRSLQDDFVNQDATSAKLLPPSYAEPAATASTISSTRPARSQPVLYADSVKSAISRPLVMLAALVACIVAVALVVDHFATGTLARSGVSAPTAAKALRRTQAVPTLDLVPKNVRSLPTVAGMLHIDRESGLDELRVSGLRFDVGITDYLHFLSISHYPTEDLVLLARNCGGTSCTYTELSFIHLSATAPTRVETSDDFVFGSDILETLATGISLEGDITRVDLGLLNGRTRWAEIGPNSPLRIGSREAPVVALEPAECQLAAELLQWCSDFTEPCDNLSFQDCSSMSLALSRQLNYLSSQTTGFNLPRFEQACVEASHFRVPPGLQTVQSEICSGANPAQWAE